MVAVTDASGTLISQQRYLPFGQVRTDTNPPFITQTDLGYTGQRNLDAQGNVNLGLMDYRARMYDAALGRFIQPDTIIPNPINPQSLNRFSYVGNNPIALTDPTGHRFTDCGPDNSMCGGTPGNDPLNDELNYGNNGSGGSSEDAGGYEHPHRQQHSDDSSGNNGDNPIQRFNYAIYAPNASIGAIETPTGRITGSYSFGITFTNPWANITLSSQGISIYDLDWTTTYGGGIHTPYYSTSNGNYTVAAGIEPANYANNIRTYLSVRGTSTINIGNGSTLGINARVKLDNDVDPKNVTAIAAVGLGVVAVGVVTAPYWAPAALVALGIETAGGAIEYGGAH